MLVQGRLLGFVLFTAALTSVTCNKDYTDFDVCFYTDNTDSQPWILYVDGKSQGALVFSNGNPQCEAPESLAGLSQSFACTR